MLDMVDIFPTRLCGCDLNDRFDFDDLYNRLLSLPHGSYPGLIGDAESSFFEDGKVLDHEDFAELKMELQERVVEYANLLGILPPTITNSWFNTMHEGASLFPHHHRNSVITGALYINSDDNASPISFDSPLEAHKMNEYHDNQYKTPYNQDGYDIPAKKGYLVLFPSWLTHHSRNNNSPIRTVLSFNTDNFFRKSE